MKYKAIGLIIDVPKSFLLLYRRAGYFTPLPWGGVSAEYRPLENHDPKKMSNLLFSSQSALTKEWQTLSGVEIPVTGWQHITTMQHPEEMVDYYFVFTDTSSWQLPNTLEVRVAPIKRHSPEEMMPHLDWMALLACDEMALKPLGLAGAVEIWAREGANKPS